MTKTFRRAHLRAPLKTSILYVEGEYVQKCKCANISEGGILLKELPSIPEISAMPLMFSIPNLPEFSALTTAAIMGLDKSALTYETIRLKARMVREFKESEKLDAIFNQNIGCEFVVVDEKSQLLIADYVRTLAKNVVYLLGLFEQKTKNEKNIDLIRKVAKLLHYESDMKLSLLRLKVLHDYQSLESL